MFRTAILKAGTVIKLAGFFLLFGCTDPSSTSKGVIYDSLDPLRDSLEAALRAKDTVRISYINNSNSECEIASDSMEFKWPIHLAKNESGFVRVRSDASCFEVDSCFHNLIGTIPDNQWV